MAPSLLGINMNDEEWAEYKRTGIIPFAEQVFWSFQGDRQRADGLRGMAMQVVNRLKAANPTNQIASDALRLDDGSIIQVNKAYNFIYVTVFCPEKKRLQPGQEPVIIPVLQPGQFYYVPGCIGRYFFGHDDLRNEIYLPPSYFAEGADTTNTGRGMSFLTLKEVGLPYPSASPDGSISRDAKVCYLPGANPDSGYSGSRLEMAPPHIPTSGPFSISCVVRLRKEIAIDYTFTSKTKELDCGYQVYNPVKPRFLFSDDGEVWTATCPGSLAPLVGYKIPSRFSNHWVNFTYPWPGFNEDFVTGAETQIGYREIGTVCPDEPLMASDYDAASPCWDKVATGALETLGGEYQSGWEENTEVANAAPYASFCTFKVDGAHGKDAGTRVVASLFDGSKRYATVVSYIYEYNGDGSVKDTILTLKDYQYKRYMTSAQPSLTFGPQPFPVNHPQGYMVGMNLLGMAWYNGNRIIAGKISDFQTEYATPPIVSAPLDVGEWHHVCMTYGESGKTRLFVTKLGSKTVNITEGTSAQSTFFNTDGWGNSVKIMVGADDWHIAPSEDSEQTRWTSEWIFSAYMDIAMLRFYKRELSKGEARLLLFEAFHGEFVADDLEATQLQGNDLIPITLQGE